MSADVPQFGQPDPTRIHVPRPGAYALVRDDQARVLCVRSRSGLHLPGGGLDPGEEAEVAVLRELAEEAALRGRVTAHLGRANQFVIRARDGLAINKLGAFLAVTVEGPAENGDIPEHEVLWLEPAEAAELLHHEFQRWAVRRFC